MKMKRLKVEWDKRFPMRAAVRVVHVARRFQSRILLRAGTHVADARSILSIIILVSSMASYMDIEASGADEQEALQAVTEQLSHSSERPG